MSRISTVSYRECIASIMFYSPCFIQPLFIMPAYTRMLSLYLFAVYRANWSLPLSLGNNWFIAYRSSAQQSVAMGTNWCHACSNIWLCRHKGRPVLLLNIAAFKYILLLKDVFISIPFRFYHDWYRSNAQQSFSCIATILYFATFQSFLWWNFAANIL